MAAVGRQRKYSTKPNEDRWNSHNDCVSGEWKLTDIFFTVCQADIFLTVCQADRLLTMCQADRFWTVCQADIFLTVSS